MRVILISDTHGMHESLTPKGGEISLPDGDLLIHAGDFTGVGQRAEVESFIYWTAQQAPRYTHGVVFIAGNHDKSFDPKYFREYEDYDLWDDLSDFTKPLWLRNILSDLESNNSRVTYLENQQITLGGFKIWGSPVTPWFHGDHWAFNRHRGPEIKEVWDQIPMDTDIIVTHGPVAYKLDYIPFTDEYVGCEDLRKAVEKIKPVLFVNGHIHEGYGKVESQDTLYVNASTCDRFYEPVNKPIVLDLDLQTKSVIY